MTNPFTEIKLDCWDYCFSESGHDTVWFATSEKGVNSSVITYVTDNAWRFLFLSDTKEKLIADIEHAKNNNPHLASLTNFYPVSTQLHAILKYWRMIRYNGRNVCAMQTRDMYPENPYAWPTGPIAPIRNAFVYTAVLKSDGSILSTSLDMSKQSSTKPDIVELPIAASSVTNLINEAGIAGCDPDDLIDNYYIVVRNVCELSAEHPFIYWHSLPFPLLAVVSLNPNHNGDPEENLLYATS